jgi:hypothetical protein
MSFWGALGRGLLKIAPIAANFIPGVGPLASMAIGGLTSGLSKKLSGGSWLDALKAGGIGAAAGYAGAKIPVKGLGPSKGFWGTTGNVLKRTGIDMLSNAARGGGSQNTGYGGYGTGRGTPPFVGDGGGYGGFQNMLGDIVNNRNRGGQSRGQGGYSYGRGDEQAVNRGGGMSSFANRMRRQLGPVMGQEDQSNPNLAMSIGAGRMDAMRNQPWRGGYDVYSEGPEPNDDSQGNSGPPMVDRMPPIYPTGQRRRNPYGNELGGGY